MDSASALRTLTREFESLRFCQSAEDYAEGTTQAVYTLAPFVPREPIAVGRQTPQSTQL